MSSLNLQEIRLLDGISIAGLEAKYFRANTRMSGAKEVKSILLFPGMSLVRIALRDMQAGKSQNPREYVKWVPWHVVNGVEPTPGADALLMAVDVGEPQSEPATQEEIERTFAAEEERRKLNEPRTQKENDQTTPNHNAQGGIQGPQTFRAVPDQQTVEVEAPTKPTAKPTTSKKKTSKRKIPKRTTSK